MIFLTAYVVVSRYVFGIGILSLQELIIYCHGITFLVCSAYALKKDQHVRVDIFYRKFSKRRKKIINLFGNIFFLQPMLWVILILSIDYVSFSWLIKETSAEPGGLPFVYLYKSIILVSAVLLIMQSFANILSYFNDD
ncbi:TRAP transporter small permease subunit [SAR86 cluster bacterium]|nr:TRAP transporter small permease subunit [SAR86 cluster bacterium]